MAAKLDGRPKLTMTCSARSHSLYKTRSFPGRHHHVTGSAHLDVLSSASVCGGLSEPLRGANACSCRGWAIYGEIPPAAHLNRYSPLLAPLPVDTDISCLFLGAAPGGGKGMPSRLPVCMRSRSRLPLQLAACFLSATSRSRPFQWPS